MAIDAVFRGGVATAVGHVVDGLRRLVGVKDDHMSAANSLTSAEDAEGGLSAMDALEVMAAHHALAIAAGKAPAAAEDDDKHTPNRTESDVRGRRGRKSKPASRLRTLPPELQLLIVSNLEFGDVERLRRTCKFYRHFVSPKTVRELFGPGLRNTLLAHCYLCLAHDPARTSLLWADYQDPRYPLASKCVDCAVDRDELRVGRKVALGNFASVWVCRWCGYPIRQNTSAWSQPEFHRECYEPYNKVLLAFSVIGLIQFCAVVVGGALLWTYYKHDKIILIPSIVDFIIAIWALLFIVLRESKTRTYHWSLFLELVCLGLWIPPVYTIAGHIKSQPDVRIPRNVMAVLVFCGLNMFFRLMNAIGNIFLLCEYKVWRQNKPRVPAAKRILNRIILAFIFWTYPQSLEQEFPGRYRF